MSRGATLSALGLYEWDNTVFDLFQLPAPIDRDTLIQNLLAQTAELEILYPNPVVFKNLVGIWSAKQLDIWNRLYATTQYEYNPIENYDRMETGSETGAGTVSHSGTDTKTETETHSGADGRTESRTEGGRDSVTGSKTSGGSDTVTDGGRDIVDNSSQMAQGGSDGVSSAATREHSVAAFDSVASGADDGLVKQTRDNDTGNTTTNYGKTESAAGQQVTTHGKTEQTSYGKTESGTEQTSYGHTEDITESKTFGERVSRTGGITHGEQIRTDNTGGHTLRAHGNIGVTTTQEMIKQQRQIELFNIYDIIIEDFKMRFCILVY